MRIGDDTKSHRSPKRKLHYDKQEILSCGMPVSIPLQKFCEKNLTSHSTHYMWANKRQREIERERERDVLGFYAKCIKQWTYRWCHTIHLSLLFLCRNTFKLTWLWIIDMHSSLYLADENKRFRAGNCSIILHRPTVVCTSRYIRS